ncbi:MAG: hypothetical protein NDJ90_14170 [Oligoflexia bacterium]|nr:hypothetical protein [Oligoflexia bacterium]
MKKRFLVLIVFGVTFSPAVFAEGVNLRNGEMLMSDMSAGSYQCSENRAAAKKLAPEVQSGSERGVEKIEGAGKGL